MGSEWITKQHYSVIWDWFWFIIIIIIIIIITIIIIIIIIIIICWDRIITPRDYGSRNQWTT